MARRARPSRSVGSSRSRVTPRIVAHNARFDLAFLDREVERLTGRRIAAPVVDTVWLARRLLGERTRRVGLASLAHFFGVPTEPCHRALPDAQATAEILVVLIGLAQERGARTLADLVELAAPRARRLHAKRSLVAGAPPRPGVYVFRGAGRARRSTSGAPATSARGCARTSPAAVSDRRSRRRSGRSSASSGRRPAPSSRPRSRSCGCCASCGRPRTPGARGPTGTSTSAAAAGGGSVATEPTALGPLTSRRRARRARRALDGHEADDVEAALPVLRERLRRLGRELRFEDAARLRDRLAALEQVVGRARRARAAPGAARVRRRPGAEPGLRPGVRHRRRAGRGDATLPRGGGRDASRPPRSSARLSAQPRLAGARGRRRAAGSSPRSSGGRRRSSAWARSRGRRDRALADGVALAA